MAINVNNIIDAIYVRDPNLRNVNGLEQIVRDVVGLADPVPVEKSPIEIQRVDTRQPNGTTVTTWEVVDRRKPKNTRIVKTGLASRAAAVAEGAKLTVGG